MLINATFHNKAKLDRREHKKETKEVDNIVVLGLNWKRNQREIKDICILHRPEGFGWLLQNYDLVEE